MDTPTGIVATYECTVDVGLAAPMFVGAGGAGNRAVVGVTGGTVAGPRINGTMAGPGADWLLLGGDGHARVDVRAQIATSDGAFIYVSYLGVLELNDVATAALLDPEVETTFDDQYFRTTPRMECGDERYEWVNQTVFVARGRLTKSGVAYEVYRV